MDLTGSADGLIGAVIGTVAGAGITLGTAVFTARATRNAAREQLRAEAERRWCLSASQAASMIEGLALWIRDFDQTHFRTSFTHPDHPWSLIAQIDQAIRDIQSVEDTAPDHAAVAAASAVREPLTQTKIRWLEEIHYDGRVQTIKDEEVRASLKQRRYNAHEALQRNLDALLGDREVDADDSSAINRLRQEVRNRSQTTSVAGQVVGNAKAPPATPG
jgi:hypothetical protein